MPALRPPGRINPELFLKMACGIEWHRGAKEGQLKLNCPIGVTREMGHFFPKEPI
jgi:hypothetical protein